MKCPNPACKGGLVPRDRAVDTLVRLGAEICGTCGGAGNIDAAAKRRLGNVGPGLSGILPLRPPRAGSAAREVAEEFARRCKCLGGQGECDGGCCD